MTRRHYSSTAVRTVLSGGIDDSETIITVDSVTGFPSSKPYSLTLDLDTASEEIVEVTDGSGTTLVITRGVDGTSGIAHLAGAVVAHVMTARDLDEPNDHINSTSGVHGVTGEVVGDSDTQTLTNKTIDGDDNTFQNIPESAVTDLIADLAEKAVYPSQTGNAGKVLGTDGSSVSWTAPVAGADGSDGASAYDVAVADGFVGDETAWLASLVGAQGDPGDPGADGADGVGVPAGGSTGQVLSKIDGTDYNTQWSTPSDDIPKSLIDAKGDLIVGSADNTVARLAAGSDGQVLTASAAATNGLAWATPAGGGGGGLVLVDSGTFSAAADFSLPGGSFDSTFDQYLFLARLTASATANFRARLRASGADDSGAHYGSIRLGVRTGLGSYALADDDGNTWWHIAQAESGGRPVVVRAVIWKPAVAVQTELMGESSGGYAAGNFYFQSVACSHDQSTAYDSITLAISAGDMTGEWQLYGYSK